MSIVRISLTFKTTFEGETVWREDTMHPDEAVGLAMQELRTLEAQPSRHHAPLASAAPQSLWGRYLEGWTWYVREGRTPPAAAGEVGHLPRRGIVPAAAPRIPLPAAVECPPLAMACPPAR
jgi:hypothetical protein